MRGNRKHETKGADILITQSELGRLIGRGRAWISRLCKRGVLSVDKSGKLFRETALAEYAAFIAQGGGQTSPAGQSLEPLYRELAEARLAFARLKIKNQELANHIAEIRAEIQQGKYVHLETLKRTGAFDFAPTHSDIRGLAARIVWALAPTRERAVELQQIFDSGIRLAYLKHQARDLKAEKKRMLEAADELQEDCQDERARSLAEKVREVYTRIEPELLDSLQAHIIGAAGNLEAIEDPARLEQILDGVLIISRDHTREPAPIVLETRTRDQITLTGIDKDDCTELILGLLGAPRDSENRSPVVAKLEVAAVRFTSRIGDAIPPYSERKVVNQ
jgi:hypothetical protein